MKKLIFCSVILLLIISCNSDSKDDKKAVENSGDVTKNPDYKKGLTLIANDKTCLTCHAINEKLTGPAYSEIAKRYADYPDTIIPHLARKVMHGGSGQWGEIYMTPHPELSQQDAEAMVKYILLLKK
jgi:cytochrome c